MDKRTIQVVIGCMLALFGVQFVINKIYPPVPKKVKPVTISTNAAAPVVTNLVEAIEPAVVETNQRPAEQIIAVSNAFIRVEFTSWGGGIRSVELLTHKANGHGNAVLNGPAVVPALVIAGVPGAGSNAVFSLEQKNPQTVVMRAGGVTKTLTLGNDYVIQGNVALAGKEVGNIFISAGTAGPASEKETPAYLIVDWQGAPKFFSRDLSRVAKNTTKGENREPIRAHWVAVKSQYFAQIVSTPTNAMSVTYVPVTLPSWPSSPGKPAPRGVTATMEVPLTHAADGTSSCAFTFYAGPKDYDRLLALGKNQEEAMDFGSWMDFYSGFFGWALLRSLNFFYGLIPNYGAAIILVTLALKIAFWPIQAKSIKSMKEMQRFQPQLAKLKEKYKDDAARLNQETMKLYKEHKINPFAGCLPMLVQLPVLIAFYKVLVSDIALRGATFLWIKDLALPDTVAMVAGFAINPLPLVMVGSMIWQQKLTPTTGDPQQAKMMMFMPLIMLMFFYTTASGLTLYWTLQQLLSILQQWRGMRKDQKTAAGAPAIGKLK